MKVLYVKALHLFFTTAVSCTFSTDASKPLEIRTGRAALLVHVEQQGKETIRVVHRLKTKLYRLDVVARVSVLTYLREYGQPNFEEFSRPENDWSTQILHVEQYQASIAR